MNEEYCVVRDSLEDDDEVIYSEVEIIDRSSKELKEIIDDLLKRYKNSDQEDCGGNSWIYNWKIIKSNILKKRFWSNCFL